MYMLFTILTTTLQIVQSKKEKIRTPLYHYFLTYLIICCIFKAFWWFSFWACVLVMLLLLILATCANFFITLSQDFFKKVFGFVYIWD